MDTYSLVTQYKGYVNKADITNLESGYLVSPSQNVFVDDGNNVSSRAGYTLLGAENSALTPIISSYDWKTSTGTEVSLRKYDVELEYYYNSSWRRLNNTLFAAAAHLEFAPWWSAAGGSGESKDLLLFVDGTSNLYMWSGGVTTLASVTANTITKQGTNTWAQDRFLLAGTRTVVLGGITYTYTGGEGTTTLTGVTGDPTAGSHVAGDVIVQSIRVSANTPGTNTTSDIITVARNQVYIADFSWRDVFVSKNTDYTVYTFGSPRLPGEGALLTLDSPPIGFAIQEENVYVSSNDSDWYKTSFTLSSDNTKEVLEIKKLQTGRGQGAYSQGSIAQAKNQVLYFSNEKVIDSLGRVENIATPQSLPISDPIKSELLSYSLVTKPHSIYFRNQTWITFPSEGKQLIFDHNKGYWMPPQTMPISRFAIIGGNLCGHSSSTPETFTLLDGKSDNGFSINHIAAFAYRNFGKRANHKDFDEWYTEGYISSNAKLTLSLNFEYQGSRGVLEYEIDGNNDDILYSSSIDSSLGKNPLGSEPMGSTTDAIDDLAKFRSVNNIKKAAFFEVQATYSSNEVNSQWKLLASGPNVAESTINTAEIQV